MPKGIKRKPWEIEGVSRSTYMRHQRAAREAAAGRKKPTAKSMTKRHTKEDFERLSDAAFERAAADMAPKPRAEIEMTAHELDALIVHSVLVFAAASPPIDHDRCYAVPGGQLAAIFRLLRHYGHGPVEIDAKG